MFSKWQWVLGLLTRTLWVRATMYAVMAVIAALLATTADRLVPFELPFFIETSTIDDILGILASSMLAVTTFSLSVMVSAYGAVTSNVTPRTTKLVRQDTTTQTVLATFIGSWLFSLVGIIALNTGVYGENGRIVLFAFSLIVVVIIVVTILRWIEHLSLLGRVGATTDRVEKVTTEALDRYIDKPCLGGQPLKSRDEIPNDTFSVFAMTVGYVQHLDVARLQSIADDLDCHIYVACTPGAFVHKCRPLVFITQEPDEDCIERVRNAFTMAFERTYEQDPRFGLSVIAEIASRALSPAVNDPGTAIDVIGRGVRLFTHWADYKTPDPEQAPCQRVHVPLLDINDLYEDFFMPIARDGSALVGVQTRLQKAFIALAQLDAPDLKRASLRYSERAFAHAQHAMSADFDKKRIRELASRVKTLTAE